MQSWQNILTVFYCLEMTPQAAQSYPVLLIYYVACVGALGESRACPKPPALPYLLVLSEDEKSDWFKMKQIC
jgi:hypothetical protein